MSFTVIIPTLNRIKEPLLMLDSLLDQSFKDFEVILVDQNKDELLEKDLVKYKNLKLKHIKTSQKGASNARNIGIENSTKEILTFPDDDCEFYPTFLEEIHDYFNETKAEAIVVTSKDKFDGKAISAFMSNRSQDINRDNVLKTVVEFAIIIKKSSLKNLRFDPEMGVGSELTSYWSDEGPDFVLRGIRQNIKFKYCPKFFMYHPNPVKIYNEKTSKRSYLYGKGRGYFLKKHNYGLKGIGKYLCIYIIGFLLGVFSFNYQKVKYFINGFKGRYEGYFLS